MEKDELESIKEKYKYEIASFKRVKERFESFRSWLVTTSLASLAFVLTFLLQIRIQTHLPNVLLAEIAIGFLIFAVICALYTRVCYETSNMVGDVADFAILLPVFVELIRKDEKTSEEEKSNFIDLLENQIKKIDNLDVKADKFNPYVEIIWLSITGIVLAIGLCVSCAYFWFYLF